MISLDGHSSQEGGQRHRRRTAGSAAAVWNKEATPSKRSCFLPGRTSVCEEYKEINANWIASVRLVHARTTHTLIPRKPRASVLLELYIITQNPGWQFPQFGLPAIKWHRLIIHRLMVDDGGKEEEMVPEADGQQEVPPLGSKPLHK